MHYVNSCLEESQRTIINAIGFEGDDMYNFLAENHCYSKNAQRIACDAHKIVQKTVEVVL